MANWISHMIIADRVLPHLPDLDAQAFCVGSIAPDCNVENADWTHFTPSRETTHFMLGSKKHARDAQHFLSAYRHPDDAATAHERAFLWGYYAHLITDAAFQAMVIEPTRVDNAWRRMDNHPLLCKHLADRVHTWDTIKELIPKHERMKDIHRVEREYLDTHPDSSFFSHLLPLEHFPDYLPFLPPGAILRKKRIMCGIPDIASEMPFAFIAISRAEYADYLDCSTQLVLEGIRRNRQYTL